MSPYQRKRILFIAPKFYHYHQAIIDSLKEKGSSVQFYPEMKHSLLYRIAQKLSPKIGVFLEKKYVYALLSKIQKNSFDIVFIIRGGYFSVKTMEKLHVLLPYARFYMYQWDSVRQNNYLDIIKYFDRVQTFDMADAEKYNLEYLPLFYTRQYKNLQTIQKNIKYDLFFLGAYHSDRLEIIKKIDMIAKEQGLIFKHHLYITKLALFRLFITRKISFSDLQYFKTYTLSVNNILEIYKYTQAILDVELNIQNGFTIRTIEVLGANLKLVTTNKNILHSDFYDADKIWFLDRNKMHLSKDFFDNKRLKPSVDNLYIDKWLDSILVAS